jgi:hypothetical protein
MDFSETLTRGKVGKREYRIFNKTGESIPVEIDSAVMKDRKREVQLVQRIQSALKVAV